MWKAHIASLNRPLGVAALGCAPCSPARARRHSDMLCPAPCPPAGARGPAAGWQGPCSLSVGSQGARERKWGTRAVGAGSGQAAFGSCLRGPQLHRLVSGRVGVLWVSSERPWVSRAGCPCCVGFGSPARNSGARVSFVPLASPRFRRGPGGVQAVRSAVGGPGTVSDPGRPRVWWGPGVRGGLAEALPGRHGSLCGVSLGDPLLRGLCLGHTGDGKLGWGVFPRGSGGPSLGSCSSHLCFQMTRSCRGPRGRGPRSGTTCLGLPGAKGPQGLEDGKGGP